MGNTAPLCTPHAWRREFGCSAVDCGCRAGIALADQQQYCSRKGSLCSAPHCALAPFLLCPAPPPPASAIALPALPPHPPAFPIVLLEPVEPGGAHVAAGDAHTRVEVQDDRLRWAQRAWGPAASPPQKYFLKGRSIRYASETGVKRIGGGAERGNMEVVFVAVGFVSRVDVMQSCRGS